MIVLFLSNQHFIRGFLGDVIVIGLIYSVLKIFLDTRPSKLIVYVLLFAYAVEFLQYLNLVEMLGLKDYKLARIVIGTTFDFKDLLAYTIGALLVFLIERYKTVRG
ncbi:ribosomal maturation YjgA family protein [Flammeovirga aprica]|uniref:DUF2809 domain-containing protein n=1 Tax=Flammeovirga aprica JL-4 TaxID=694437 RepID=A0A7X9S192_9BACT|nr:DUF2809 domain-containing protein [Flammeovirga aprica]NME72399.1 DUF2809 domain-containing protein [Flammeovirga aprica JL-4]